MTTYEVRPDPVPATTGALTTAEITAILGRLDGAALQDAGAAHTQLGRELATMAAHLAQEAGTLAQNWSGVAARAALAQLRRLHQQTATLATQASRTGAVLTWLGTQVLPALNRPATPTQARQFLTHLTTALTQADKSLPAITSKGTTSPGVTISPGVTRPGVTTRPGAAASTTSTISHSRPIILTSTTSHSGQVSPIGTPLTAGPTHPASQVSSLQSAAPVPNPAPIAPVTASPAPAAAAGPAPTPGPIALANVPPAAGTTAAAPSESTPATPATSAATPGAPPATADVTPGALATPVTPAQSTTATKGRTTSPRDPDDNHQAQPPSTAGSPGLSATPAPATVPSTHAAATSALPGFPGAPAAAPAPQVTTSGPPLSARPLPELPTLDSGLSGGALPLPTQPAITPTAMSAPAPAPHSFLPPPAAVPDPARPRTSPRILGHRRRQPLGPPRQLCPPAHNRRLASRPLLISALNPHQRPLPRAARLSGRHETRQGPLPRRPATPPRTRLAERTGAGPHLARARSPRPGCSHHQCRTTPPATGGPAQRVLSRPRRGAEGAWHWGRLFDKCC